jgi:predicted permease
MNGLLRKLLELLRPGRLDDDTVEELSHHVEVLVARKVAQGLDAGEARRQAFVEVGSVASAREQVADARTGFALEQLARELRYAARTIRRSPGLSLLSIATMGMGIGVSALLFTLISGIALRPLPYPQADRLVRIFDINPGAGIDRTGVTTGNVADWRGRTTAFDGIAAYYEMGRTVAFDGDADVLMTAQVSEDFFDVLRVGPAIGRTFTPDEARRATFSSAAAPTGADPVVVLSHRVWMQRFNGDPAAIGRTFLLERRPFKVIGVMPPGFAMPDPGVELWIPWSIVSDGARDQHYVSAVARLAPDVPVAQAERMLNGVARDLAAAYPDTNRGWGVQLSTLADETVGDTAKVLWILLTAVGLVLLVACANVALLSVIRGMDRRHETAVRLALGASPGRLLRELLLESTLLAVLGGAVGTAIAAVGLRLLPALTTNLPRLHEVVFDYRAMAVIAAITLVCAVLSGLPQAWSRARLSPLSGMSATRTRVSEGLDRHWFRNGIVVVQVAMAVVLMTGAGLCVRSVLQLRAADPGFDPEGVLVVPIFLDSQAYPSGEKSRVYYRALFDKLAALPKVIAVGGSTTVPASPLGPDFERPVWPQGSGGDRALQAPAAVRIATPGYFKAMRLRVIEGRPIDETDGPQTAPVLMVSETLAKRLWPGESPVGRQLVVDYSTAGTYPYQVVGVVGDVRFRGPRSRPLPEIYLAHAQRSYLILNVVVKTEGDPRALISQVRAALKEIDALKPPHGVYPLRDLLGDTYARDRQVTLTLSLFACAAIALALMSVYGVLAQRVRERSQEIGIRMALGADARNVVGWVAESGLRLIVAGLALGVLVARGLVGALDRLLFEVAATDPLTTMLVVGLVAGVGAMASLVPAWRATRIDPVRVLRGP